MSSLYLILSKENIHHEFNYGFTENSTPVKEIQPVNKKTFKVIKKQSIKPKVKSHSTSLDHANAKRDFLHIEQKWLDEYHVFLTQRIGLDEERIKKIRIFHEKLRKFESDKGLVLEPFPLCFYENIPFFKKSTIDSIKRSKKGNGKYIAGKWKESKNRLKAIMGAENYFQYLKFCKNFALNTLEDYYVKN